MLTAYALEKEDIDEMDEIDPLVGKCVRDRFIVEQRLDQGGFGAVYLAQDLQLVGRKVVIKVLLENLIHDAEARRKFEHEKEALARLDHPGVVSILGAGALPDGKPYLVMPYIEGCNLKNIMEERGALPLSFCAKVIESLTDALSAAHAQGILHRDVKPANIILTEQPDGTIRTRLIDFGIARVYESKISPVTQVEKFQGTVWYVAPEQLQGRLEQDITVDVFSCSVVLYEMLTGRLPFQPQTVYEMYQLHQEGLKQRVIDLRPEVPVKADLLITEGLSYDPSERPQDIKIFGRTLALSLLERADMEDRQLGEDVFSGVKTNCVPSLPNVSSDKSSLLKSELENKDTPLYENDYTFNDNIPVNSELNRNANSNLQQNGYRHEQKADVIKQSEQTAKINRQPALNQLTLPAQNPSSAHQEFNATVNKDIKKNIKYLILFGIGGISLFVIMLSVGFILWNLSNVPNIKESSSAENNNVNQTKSSMAVTEKTVESEPISTIASLDTIQTVSYYLMGQRLRNGKPYKEPFRSIGEHVFESGYEVTIFFNSQRAGYVYLFDESKNERGGNDYYILFPTPTANKGKAFLPENSSTKTMPIGFNNDAGTEKVWLIWSAQEIPELEQIREEAFQNGFQINKTESINTLQKFLRVTPNLKTEDIKENGNQSKIVRIAGNSLTYLFELTHISN